METQTPVPTLPPDPSLATRVRLGYQALMIAKDDPGNPEAGALINDCFEQEVYARLVEHMRGHPDGARLLSERPSLQGDEVDLVALLALPEGTLGHELARYYDDHGITPFDTTQPLLSDVDYVSKRYRETHDIYHLLTGYGTDVLGEMELQAFVRGNLGSRAPLMMLPFGWLASRFGVSIAGDEEVESLPLSRYVRRVRAARRRGAAVPPLITIPFEDFWDHTVEELRRRWLEA
jgi:ubiquinone biosynthesis protein COQ4